MTIKTKKVLSAAERVYEAYKKGKNNLSERERDIIESYFGFDGKFRHTLEEIGAEYKVTRERIRQIKMVALRKIGLKSD